MPLRSDQPRRGDGHRQGPGHQAPGPHRKQRGPHPAVHRRQSANQEQRAEDEEDEDRAEPNLQSGCVQREVAAAVGPGRVPDPAGRPGAELNRGRRIVRPGVSQCSSSAAARPPITSVVPGRCSACALAPAHHRSTVSSSPPTTAAIAARRYVMCPRLDRASRESRGQVEITGRRSHADHGCTLGLA